MHELHFYRDKKYDSPILQYLEDLAQKNDKDSRIKLNKIATYLQILQEYGTQAGEPYIKHIEGEIWELRPLRDRIFFVCWINDGFMLLHHFMKKTQKTPAREIAKAKKALADIIERSKTDENDS